MRHRAIGIGLCLAAIGSAATAGAAKDWSWLFPLAAPAPVNRADADTRRHLPGSDAAFTRAQIQDLQHAVDWFPAQHPAMPAIVSTGHDVANACGYCHLPTGNGRPENSALAGLSPDYIKRQVAAFAQGSRRSALSTALPAQLMAATAQAVSTNDVAQAAAYFGRLRYRSHVSVVETSSLAFEPGRFVYRLRPGPRTPIGDRIIEVPVDPERFELRDPGARFIAYVAPGSLAAGRALVAAGGPAGQPCAACHGNGLRGGIAPPLAGRSPTMLMRQLVGFQTGSRAEAEAAPMRIVSAKLNARQMVALSAYAASLKP